MLILWRYLTRSFLRVLLLSVASLAAILLVTRLDEIVKYAMICAGSWDLITFALHQTAFLIPIALPIACMLSSYLLFHRLSASGELTALRASGMSFAAIAAPVLICAAYLAIANFYFVSEWGTKAHRASRQMESSYQNLSLVQLLQHDDLVRIGDLHVHLDGKKASGNAVEGALIAYYHTGGQRMHLVSLESLQEDKHAGSIQAQGVHWMATAQDDASSSRNTFEPLLIENSQTLEADIADLSGLIKKSNWRLKPDHLGFAELLSGIKEESGKGRTMSWNRGMPLNAYYTDIARRFSIAFAAFSFTCVGIASGVCIGRRKRKKGLFIALGMALLFLIAFFISKNLANYLLVSTGFALLPHIICIFIALRRLQSISQGVE